MYNTKFYIYISIIILSIATLFMLNLILGTISIPFKSVWNIILGNNNNEIWANIIWKTRFPQTITSIFAGAGLAISGLQMQTLFRNPLAGPSELGISSGASLGVALVVLASGSIGGVALSKIGIIGEITVSLSAIIGSMIVMSLIVLISQKIKGNVVLLIIGVMIGYIANAIIGVLKFFSNDEDVRSYVIWGLGSFSRVSNDQLLSYSIIMTFIIAISFLLIKTLNLMLLGDNYARNLGLNIKRARLSVIICACLLTSIITSYCGPITFLGLAVPHLCRTIFNSSDHKILMPSVALVGMCLALVCNLISRIPGFEGVLPINSVTALIGAPIVISVLFGKRKNELAI